MIEPNKDCRFVGRYYTIMCGILFYYIYGGKIEQVSAFDYFLGKHQIFDSLFSDCLFFRIVNIQVSIGVVEINDH